MDATYQRDPQATADEARDVQRLQRKILSRFLVVFSAPVAIILSLAVMAYQLHQKVEKIELLQDIMLQEIFYQKGKSYAQLIKGYETLAAHDFFSPRMASRLASLYFERNTGNDRAHAVQQLQAAQHTFPDTGEIAQTLCAFYTFLNREEEALTTCEHAIALAPDDHQSYNNAAWIYAHATQPERHDLDKALRYAAQAVQLTTEQNTEDLDTLAEVYFLKGDADKARETITKAAVVLDKTAYYRAQMDRFHAHQGTGTTER
jgi:tetratricopeptide (TPR) repeat protein